MGAWFSSDADERRDAQRVEELENSAKAAEPDFVAAARYLAEADELRAKWNEPRQRFASVAELVEELEAIARDARDLDQLDPDALDELGERAGSAGAGLESFAWNLRDAVRNLGEAD